MTYSANIETVTKFLSLFWGIFFVTSAMLLLFDDKKRDILLTKLADRSSRRVFGIINLVIAGIHIIYYQGFLGGNDLPLMLIGWSAAIKGGILISLKELPQVFRKMIHTNFYDWALFVAYLVGLYFLNNALNFIPEFNLMT